MSDDAMFRLSEITKRLPSRIAAAKRKLAEDAQQAAEAQAERQRANAAYWAAHDAKHSPAGNVLVYKRGSER